MTTNHLDLIQQPPLVTKSQATQVITRFAPSPTGYIHIGNLRTALFSYLYAKSNNGKFLLRIEDSDQERSKPEYIAALIKDFNDLGIKWDDDIVYQSKRIHIYEEFYSQLQQQGIIYRCFCSEEKLALSRKIQLTQGLPPRYQGGCLSLAVEQVQQKIASNQSFCWRFKVPKDLIIEFDDLIKGKQSFNSNDFGDFVIRRQDGAPSFMFCSVLDDVLQGVTQVLRGEDHVSNTPRQILILQALGLKPPQYGHFPLLTANDVDNPKLSKRSGSQSIRDFLQAGYLPAAILNYLARLGHSYVGQDNSLLTLEQLAINFKLEQISSHSANHDVIHLKFWQKQAMLSLSNQELIEILQQDPRLQGIVAGLPDPGLLDFVNLVKNNILMPLEFLEWYKILLATQLPQLQLEDKIIEHIKRLDPKFLSIVMATTDFNSLIQELVAQKFAKKQIFMDLRILLTGKTSGPELAKLFEFLGLDKIKQRIAWYENL